MTGDDAVAGGRDDVVLVHDLFDSDVRAGRVVGSRSSSGAERLGLDPTRSLAVDDGGLRIHSLRRAGWGTASFGYGSLELHDGLALGVLVTNGHNTAQSEPLGETLRNRFHRWVRGNEVESRHRRLLGWVRHGRKRWTLQRFEHWIHVARSERRGSLLLLDENLAVGFFPTFGDDPRERGTGFAMHATGHDNGELWALSDGRVRPVVTGVRNVPLYLLVVCEGDEVVFYGASVEGVRSLPSLPAVRPLAVLPRPDAAEVHPSLLQSTSGQIGFASDTRVWEMAVAHVPTWVHGPGAPAFRCSGGDAVGTGWTVPGGVGLLRVVSDGDGPLDVGFRLHESGGWHLRHDDGVWTMSRRHGTDEEMIRSSPPSPEDAPVGGAGRRDIQITDDGHRIGVTVDGRLLFDGWVDDDRDDEHEGCAVVAIAGGVHEASGHPRSVVLPAQLRPESDVARLDRDLEVWAEDRFADEVATVELGERTLGGHRWERTTGQGRILVTSAGARIDASPERPLPGRLVYTVPSPSPELVELELDVVPPGTARGQAERGRAGVVFEQADGDALVVSTWLDDVYAGASISSFFRLGGFEDLYDAIWTNVGRRVRWGEPYRLCVAFDGLVYETYLDDELVIHRSLADVVPGQPRLRIDRIGIVANWEWGTDTGSLLRGVTVRARPSVPRPVTR